MLNNRVRRCPRSVGIRGRASRRQRARILGTTIPHDPEKHQVPPEGPSTGFLTIDLCSTWNTCGLNHPGDRIERPNELNTANTAKLRTSDHCLHERQSAGPSVLRCCERIRSCEPWFDRRIAQETDSRPAQFRTKPTSSPHIPVSDSELRTCRTPPRYLP